ncbi:hypothetical protein BDP27DRAFT_1337313 [Rhodocollybia butyracea]|uniref:Uncharacterized protein n=1 Tax=Rhodocollybia butyracea TaxID=206335 RepID=A0A9P5PH22_9AGAR|nr:hypothetical protein BDP27DRAFT_1337313 [Rhodocollybia butyracea]
MIPQGNRVRVVTRCYFARRPGNSSRYNCCMFFVAPLPIDVYSDWTYTYGGEVVCYLYPHTFMFIIILPWTSRPASSRRSRTVYMNV